MYDLNKKGVHKMICITPVYKQIERHNPISGHRWAEYGDLLGYEVHGGLWTRTVHKTLAGAEREKSLRESIDKKFPMPK